MELSPTVPDQNPSMVWANLFVDELARGGLRDVCIAPGSRHSPLVLAFFAQPDIRIHSHLDERSASFFALGMALAEDRPVAVLCTSGTAGANFFPAIIEANMSQVPLLVLTADRPPELRHSGANQTIDQVKMFGDHVLWTVDIALPEEKAADIALRNLRTTAARALAAASGVRKGPVHLNFPFRKPLEPLDSKAWMASYEQTAAGSRKNNLPFSKIERGNIRPSEDQIEQLAEMISRTEEGIIVCGPRCPAGDFPLAAARLARASGYPLFADPLSGLRFGPQVVSNPIAGGYETFLNVAHDCPRPKLILQFGAAPTSKRLNNYLAECETSLHIHVRENGVWADENHRTTHFLQVDELALCVALEKRLASSRGSAWLDQWMRLEADTWVKLAQTMNEMVFDAAYVSDLFDYLPDGGGLFAGNSLPIRHVDQFARPTEKAIQVFANRGASGIDGNISTGLGIAAALGRPVTILSGDVTFYHDSNGLLALQHMNSAGITLLVLNNDGGGIFRRLPITQFDPPFRDLFQVPHGLDLASIARTYDLAYHCPSSRQALAALLASPPDPVITRLIEVKTDARIDNIRRSELEALISGASPRD